MKLALSLTDLRSLQQDKATQEIYKFRYKNLYLFFAVAVAEPGLRCVRSVLLLE